MNSASLTGCLILICEDEPLIALDIANAFTNEGARVVTALSLRDALVAVENSGLSAAILDHKLKDGDSSQLCERLKELNVPFVLHSLHSGFTHLGGAWADAVHVPKPASSAVLVTTIVGLLHRRTGTTTTAPLEPPAL
jgi:DNA-binding response OmpR family regulator